MKFFEGSKFESKPLKSLALINPKIDKNEHPDNQAVTFVPMAAVSEKVNIINLSEKRLFKEVKKGYTAFCSGDVLFAKVTPCMENGKVALVPQMDTNLGFGSTEFHVVRVKNQLHPKFLFYFIVSDFFRNEAQQKMTGAVGLRRVPASFLEDAEIPLPSFEVQERIVEKIDTLFSEIDSGTEELRKAKQKLELYKQSVLNAAIQGKLVPQDPNDEPASKLLERIRAEKEQLIKAKKIKKERPLPPVSPDEVPFELPKGWEWVRLGELCQLITKGSSPSWQGVNYVEQGKGIPFITSKNVRQFEFDWNKLEYVEDKFNEIEPRSILKNGDVLTNIVGASIGRTAVFKAEFIANINQAVCILRPVQLELSDWIALFLNSAAGIKMMGENQVEMARANLSMSEIAKFPIPLCNLAVMKSTLAYLSQSLARVEEQTKTILKVEGKTALLTQSVLKSAFEGSLI